MAFLPTPRGVIGMVDDLLALCRTRQLHIEYQGRNCIIRESGTVAEDLIVIPLPKSVFRALLARIATLCNECQAGSVTPYRGEGEIVVTETDSQNGLTPSTFHVSFINTPSDQKLELRFKTAGGQAS